jgi:hypothetical protein
MSCGERRRFIEKKQLGPAVWPHDCAADSAVLEAARYPAPDLERTHDPPMVVVEDTAISRQQTTARERRDVSKRRYAVLQRHLELAATTRRRSS